MGELESRTSGKYKANNAIIHLGISRSAVCVYTYIYIYIYIYIYSNGKAANESALLAMP